MKISERVQKVHEGVNGRMKYGINIYAKGKTKFYLEHYDAGKYCKSCEHHIVYWRYNCRIERVKCLQQKSTT